jgi:hypothetical protein
MRRFQGRLRAAWQWRDERVHHARRSSPFFPIPFLEA